MMFICIRVHTRWNLPHEARGLYLQTLRRMASKAPITAFSTKIGL